MSDRIPERGEAEGRVHLELKEGTAELWLDRPARRNALDWTMWQRLDALLQEAALARPRALVLRGEGPHFCSGMDLKPDNPIAGRALAAILGQDVEAARSILHDLKAILARLAAFPAPTIAAIEGVCVGGGLELALCCDVRIAATDARFALPEVRIGMIPDLGGTARASRLIGRGRAVLLICGGAPIYGEEAHRFGLVDRLVPTGGARTAALALAADIRRGGPIAVSLALDTLRATGELPLEDALEQETEAGAQAIASGEGQEGLTAWIERREPRWEA